MADIVKDLYAENLNQDKVLFQQKKPLLNYELNLIQDILKNRGIDLTRLGVGNNLSGDSFEVYSSILNNEIKIRKGIIYHKGRPLHLVQDVIVSGLTTPLTNRIDTVFIEWYLTEIDGTEDPNIIDTGLGIESTRQERLNIAIRVSENSDVPVPSAFGPGGETISYFTLAKLYRLGGNSLVTDAMIVDERQKFIYNFVKFGCKVTHDTGLDIAISEGNAFVADTEYYIEDTQPVLTLPANTTSYVYINSTGTVAQNTVEPTDFHLMLAEVTTNGLTVTNVSDKREYIPIAWNYKYGGGNEGETGFPTVIEKYRADENINAFDVVAISTANTVQQAIASTSVRLPAIGIAPQFIATGQVDNIVILGEISNPAWNFTPKLPVFVDISLGQITQTPPTTNNTYVQRIGVAVSPKILLVIPDSICIKNEESAEIPLLTMNTDGSIAVMNSTQKLNSARISDLASVAQLSPDKTFNILPGVFYIDSTKSNYFPGATVNMGTGGTHEVSLANAFYYNKAIFTLTSGLSVQKYVGREASTIGAVLDPVIPENELPISMVIFQDDGTVGPGTILPITQDFIIDRRNWFSLGNLENIAFKPVYLDTQEFTIHRGSAWFNNEYLTLATNLTISATLVDDTYYIYLNLQNAVNFGVTISSFYTSTDSPIQVDRRNAIPLGKFVVLANKIQESSFEGYHSKYWQFRDTPYTDEDTFTVLAGGQSVFNTTSYSFLNADYLEIDINGVEVHEGIARDYTKTSPNIITFNYVVEEGAEVTIRKV